VCDVRLERKVRLDKREGQVRLVVKVEALRGRNGWRRESGRRLGRASVASGAGGHSGFPTSACSVRAPGERSREILAPGRRSELRGLQSNAGQEGVNREACRRRLWEGPSLTFELSRRPTQIANTADSGVLDVRLERKVRASAPRVLKLEGLFVSWLNAQRNCGRHPSISHGTHCRSQFTNPIAVVKRSIIGSSKES